MPLQLFRATVANPDIGSLKSLHTFLKKMFVPYASEVRTKSYGPNYTEVWAFWKKKKRVFITILTKSDAIWEDVSVSEIIFNAKLLI